jgi:hypothetical protein
MTFSKQLFTAAALVAGLAFSPLARAGGVIIDGQVSKPCPDDSGSDTADAKADEARIAERSQQIYLFVATILNGPVVYVEEVGGTQPAPVLTANTIDDLGGEQAAGCAAAPVSLGAFAALGLLRRRRRS